MNYSINAESIERFRSIRTIKDTSVITIFVASLGLLGGWYKSLMLAPELGVVGALSKDVSAALVAGVVTVLVFYAVMALNERYELAAIQNTQTFWRKTCCFLGLSILFTVITAGAFGECGLMELALLTGLNLVILVREIAIQISHMK